ncbi:trichohyalin-like isoform X3 [Lineus longissimus]|uniref:trichohyalin-like isoform X3 n=1 Tax=Lineus longissimus TaxID=88925 RepID=UPI00315D0344
MMASGYTHISYGNRPREDQEPQTDPGKVNRGGGIPGTPPVPQRPRQPPGYHVDGVCRDWMVHEDAGLAYRLQEEEKDKHYGNNRWNRKTTREDIINAKIVQHEEELRQQEEKMREIEQKRRVADDDARMAHEEQQKLQDEEARNRLQAMDDERIAHQVMEHIMIEESERQKEQETEDERIARLLQEKEERRYERYKEKKQERELARERRRIEKSIAQQSQDVQQPSPEYDEEIDGRYGDVSHDSRGSGPRVRDSDGRLEDVGDFSDFFIPPSDEMDESQAKELQENQDMELARLLQEQEHKRGGKPNVDKLKLLEQKDAELARVIQEQEKLKLRKLKNKLKQMSVHERNLYERDHPPRPPDRSLSVSETTATHHSNNSNHSSSDDQADQQPPIPARLYTERPLQNAQVGHQRAGSEDDASPLAQHIKERDQEIRIRNLDSHWQPPLDQAPPSYPSQPRTPSSGGSDDALPPFTSRNTQAASAEDDTVPSPGGFTTTFNIAAAIDPTYNRRSKHVPPGMEPEFRTGLNRGHSMPPPPEEKNGPTPAVITHHTGNASGSALPDFDYSDDEYDDEAPPMPVQGQRRLQKGRKSKNGAVGPGDRSRSSCKQQ